MAELLLQYDFEQTRKLCLSLSNSSITKDNMLSDDIKDCPNTLSSNMSLPVLTNMYITETSDDIKN